MGPKRRTERSFQGAASGLVLGEIQNKNIQTPPKNKQLPAVSKITKAGDESPGKTSDYGGSESSRSVTPAAMSSENTSPVNLTPPESVQNSPKRPESPKLDFIADTKDAKIKDTDENQEKEEAGVGLRKVDTEADKEDETIDITEDTVALESGLISADVIKAEEAAMNRNEERHKKEKAHWAAKEEDTYTSEERFEMLMDLLKKSTFFTNYLKEKMAAETKAKELKERRQAEKAADTSKKGKGKPGSPASAKGRRSGRTQTPADDKDSPKETKSKEPEGGKKGRGKRLAEEEPEKEVHSAEERSVKKARLEGGARTWNGEEISTRQPDLLTGGVMRNYQLEGYEWLVKLYENGINGILADEMGLGKTIQCIALFCHLYEMGVPGPFLVVAPLSTVPNWVNEFKRFSPKVPVMLYHGSREERQELRGHLGETWTADESPLPMHHVLVTSYEIAINDRSVLSNIRWKFLVVDEGHRLKNMECRLIKELKQYKTEHRLLLTGTPLQNNLRELFSLLNFVLPEIFDNVEVFESWFDAKEIEESEEASTDKILQQEQKNSVVNMMHQILLPFLRRRVKADVGLEIPPKKEVLVYCPLTKWQKEMYQAVVERTLADLLKDENEDEYDKVDTVEHGRGKRSRESVDYAMFDNEKEDREKDDDKFEASVRAMVDKQEALRRDTVKSAYVVKHVSSREVNYSIKSRMMDMRKAVNHPYLIDYPITEDGNFYRTDEEVVSSCGKLKVLDQMLKELMARGHKILLFSQMTRMLDILGDYLGHRKIKFSRLDGTMNFVDRQDNIDQFNQDSEVRVFLLSTRAGGLGINLTAADTCVIYDSDWNPQQDLQAQDRCHRIGQTKPVMVYRLVTKGTIDEKIVLRAAAKRKIEKLVIHKDKFCSMKAEKDETSTKIDAQELLKLLHSKDHAGTITCADGDVLSETDLNRLLDRSNLSWGPQDAASSKKKVSPPVTEVKGVFQVLEDVEDKHALKSIVDNDN